MNGLGEAIVPADEPNAADGEEQRHDPRHPSESHDRRQESALAESVAPAKISPILSGDSGTNNPQDEEDYQSNQFATES